MSVHIFLKRIGLFAGALFFLSACESIPPNTISPEMRETLRVSDIQVSVTDEWRDVLQAEALKQANRRAEKKYKNDLLKARTRKRKAMVTKEEVDATTIKSDVDIGIREMTDMVRTKLQENFAEFQSGNRPVRIDAALASYSAANAGEIIMFGGSERIAGNATVIDIASNKPLASYGINIVIQNQGGILAALLDAAFFNDKTKRLSGLFANAVEDRFKANTYKPGVELALQQPAATATPAPQPASKPAIEDDTPADETTAPQQIEAVDELDDSAAPMVQAPPQPSADAPVTMSSDMPADTTTSQIDASVPSIDSSAQDALWRKRQEALSQPAQ